jgi:hypothetical protein
MMMTARTMALTLMTGRALDDVIYFDAGHHHCHYYCYCCYYY